MGIRHIYIVKIKGVTFQCKSIKEGVDSINKLLGVNIATRDKLIKQVREKGDNKEHKTFFDISIDENNKYPVNKYVRKTKHL